MARIDEYLQKILSARYGEEVRGAIHDSIDEINRVNEANISTVQTIADTAQGYADDAEDSKDLAAQSVTDAQAQVTLAQQQVTLATTQATNSANSAEDSEAWAVGQRGGIDVPSSDETYQNNSKYWQERANYWYQQAQAIAESFSGALRPMGTVTFENLPPLAQADSGDMYNISNQFTTTSDFVEGAGIVIPLGSNVYKTTGGKWDVLAGSPVTGVKGNSESNYRRGNVNITKGNIGLGNVDNTSDANKPISTAQQTALNSKQNITDNSLTTTSKTVPGAINEINASLSDLIADEDITVPTSSEGRLYDTSYIKKRGNMVQIEISGFKNLNTQVNNVVIHGMGTSIRPSRNLYFSHEFLDESYRIVILTNGTLNVYPYNSVTNQSNQLITINYLV